MPNNCKYAWIRRPVERSNSRCGLFSSFSWFRTRRLSSNPTASAGVDRCWEGTSKTRMCWRLARLEKRLDFRCATRNTTPQAPCTELHGRYRTPKQLARIAKNPGKTRVLQRRGQDANFSMFFQCFFESSKGTKGVTLASRQITNSKD